MANGSPGRRWHNRVHALHCAQPVTNVPAGHTRVQKSLAAQICGPSTGSESTNTTPCARARIFGAQSAPYTNPRSTCHESAADHARTGARSKRFLSQSITTTTLARCAGYCALAAMQASGTLPLPTTRIACRRLSPTQGLDQLAPGSSWDWTHCSPISITAEGRMSDVCQPRFRVRLPPPGNRVGVIVAIGVAGGGVAVCRRVIIFLGADPAQRLD